MSVQLFGLSVIAVAAFAWSAWNTVRALRTGTVRVWMLSRRLEYSRRDDPVNYWPAVVMSLAGTLFLGFLVCEFLLRDWMVR